MRLDLEMKGVKYFQLYGIVYFILNLMMSSMMQTHTHICQWPHVLNFGYVSMFLKPRKSQTGSKFCLFFHTLKRMSNPMGPLMNAKQIVKIGTWCQ
jgi:hypothetical protein